VFNRLTVMESFVAIRETTNPYQTQLVTALRPYVDVRMFSWRAALLGDFDALHVHWPEVLIRDRNIIRTSARRVLFLLVLIRLRFSGKAIVRTLHNVAPHEPGRAVENWLLHLCDRWTTHWITLNEFTPRPTDAPTCVIPHGHYLDWYAGYSIPPSERGRLLYFGNMRTYKGVEELIAAFSELADPTMRLRIVGRPEDRQVTERIDEAVRADSRISASLRHATDSETAAEFGRAELIVLPYRQMHNSGAALLALSVARPVVVPDNAVNRALALEVGAGWVLGYDGAFDSTRLAGAIADSRAKPPVGLPDLRRRGWPEIGRAHASAFERAATEARSRRPFGPNVE